MNNIASDNGAALTAAYGALAETDAKVNGSIALVQAAGGSVAPGDTGNAGIAAQQSSTEATSLAAFALVALLLVGGARVATARIRRG